MSLRRKKKREEEKTRYTITDRIINIDSLHMRKSTLLRVSKTSLIQLTSVSAAAVQTCFAAADHPSKS